MQAMEQERPRADPAASSASSAPNAGGTLKTHRRSRSANVGIPIANGERLEQLPYPRVPGTPPCWDAADAGSQSSSATESAPTPAPPVVVVATPAPTAATSSLAATRRHHPLPPQQQQQQQQQQHAPPTMVTAAPVMASLPHLQYYVLDGGSATGAHRPLALGARSAASIAQATAARHYPDLSMLTHQPQQATAPPRTDAETETESESDVASEAGAYADPEVVPHDAYDAMQIAQRRGGVVGLCDELSELDFLCPHCLDPNTHTSAEPMTRFSCCARLAHYGCLSRNPTGHQLAMNREPPCLQCLRPIHLLSHQAVLARLRPPAPNLREMGQGSGSASGGDSQSVAHIWQAYDALGAHLARSAGAATNRLTSGLGRMAAYVKVGSGGRAARPELDVRVALEAGVDMRGLLAAGWPLETIIEEFRMFDLDDELWSQLRFDKHVLLELAEADLIHFMTRFHVHPYEIRQRYRIKLPDLWRSAEQRRRGGRGRGSGSRSGSRSGSHSGSRSGGHSPAPATLNGHHHNGGGGSNGGGGHSEDASRAAQQLERQAQMEALARQQALGTDELCAHERLLTPRRLALLGFDLQHMLVMGFEKHQFINFKYFVMDDWLSMLGFSRAHWSLLRLDNADFAPGGVFASLGGWRIDVLMQYWRVPADDLLTMGVVDRRDLTQLMGRTQPPSTKGHLMGSPPAAHPPSSVPAASNASARRRHPPLTSVYQSGGGGGGGGGRVRPGPGGDPASPHLAADRRRPPTRSRRRQPSHTLPYPSPQPQYHPPPHHQQPPHPVIVDANAWARSYGL